MNTATIPLEQHLAETENYKRELTTLKNKPLVLRGIFLDKNQKDKLKAHLSILHSLNYRRQKNQKKSKK